MKQKRVTSDDLLDLADLVVKLAGQAKQSSQYGIEPRLNEVLPHILEAAKSAALAEAQDRRRMREDEARADAATLRAARPAIVAELAAQIPQLPSVPGTMLPLGSEKP